jgi:hypothetical protein
MHEQSTSMVSRDSLSLTKEDVVTTIAALDSSGNNAMTCLIKSWELYVVSIDLGLSDQSREGVHRRGGAPQQGDSSQGGLLDREVIYDGNASIDHYKLKRLLKRSLVILTCN